MNGQVLGIIWASMMVSPLLIAAVVYFGAADMAGIGGLPAGYEGWFLAGGLTSGLATLPMLRRFRQAAEQPRGTPRDSEDWQRVSAAMMTGLAVAELPFFVGFTGYLVGGYTQAGVILLIVTAVLQSRFKPPSARHSA